MDHITERFMREGSADTETAETQNGGPDVVALPTPSEPLSDDAGQTSSSAPVEEDPFTDPFYDALGKPLYKVTRTAARYGIRGRIKYTRLPEATDL